MTTPAPAPIPDRDLASPVDHALAAAMRDAGWSWGVVPDDVASQHLAAITALATEHAHVAARPPSPTWRNRMRRVAGLTIVKVAVGAGVAAAATTGGLAAGGHLPGPVQGAVADGVSWIGIDLPRPEPRPTPSPAADPEQVVDDASRSTPLEDPPADDGPAVVEDVPEDAPPVTTPSPTGPPDAVPSADGDADADTGERPDEGPPGDGPPAEPVPEQGGPPPGAPEEDDAPPSREPQGGTDDADQRDAPPSPGGSDDGQTQSGQVPTSSRR